jgi:sugar phosphate isomerase/epimerase
VPRIQTALLIATPDMPKVSYVHLFTGEIEDNVARAGRLGFDGVELLIGDPDSFASDRLAQALAAAQVKLACLNSGRLVSQFGLTLIHPERRIREEALRKFQGMVQVASRFGCAANIGLFRGAALEGKPIAYTRDLFVEILQHVCDYAALHQVRVNFEPTNRFEINFINTTSEGVDIVRRVGRGNLGLLLDLYHMYIEDPDMEEAIRSARDYVRHFHFSDSDRWPAGLGHGGFDFRALVRLLKEIGYSGFLSEGLVPTEDVDECARRTAAYLRRVIEET